MVLTSARFIIFFFFSFVFISATSFDGYFRFAGVYRARELVVTVDVTLFLRSAQFANTMLLNAQHLSHVSFTYQARRKWRLRLHSRRLSDQLCGALKSNR